MVEYASALDSFIRSSTAAAPTAITTAITQPTRKLFIVAPPVFTCADYAMVPANLKVNAHHGRGHWRWVSRSASMAVPLMRKR
jgi:hypothetical protein